MNRISTQSRVGSDGVLYLTLPLGIEQADKEVWVTVDPITSTKAMTRDQWQAFVLSTAGSITDPTFERPPQGEYEQRDLLP